MALLLKIRGHGPARALEKAADMLLKGKIVVYPTESSYALGANAYNRAAVRKLAKIKKRPAGKPFSVIVADLAMARNIARLNKDAEALARAFMPGPLTMVVPKNKKIPDEISTGTIAFRIPSNRFARELSRRCNCPIVATSANIAGEEPVYSASEAVRNFGGAADVVVDAGRLPKRKPSTIFDCTSGKVLRHGPISEARVRRVLCRAGKRTGNSKFKKLVLYDLKSCPLEKQFIGKLKQFAENVKVVFAKKEYSRGLKSSDLKGADALVVRPFDYYNNSLFENSSLRYIGAMHTDISHFNLRVLDKNCITLTNVPGYATEAVAELTLSALLNISRKTHAAMNFAKKGNWGFEKFLGWELRGKTLGIIGLGRIGTRVAEMAKCLGMDVTYFSPVRNKKLESRGIKFSQLNKLLKQSEIISLHCSLTDKTRKLLNRSNLKLIRRNAVLLNSARSELVDIDEVYKLCRQKRITVWFEAIEDKKTRKKFMALENAYLTPHFGWMTREAQQRLREIALSNIRAYLKGEPENKMNPE